IDTCVGASADRVVRELTCQQYPWATIAGVTCPARPACGDGAVNAPGEQCDDGNLTLEDGCSDNCIPEYCGDGVTQPAMGEQCDEGEALNGSPGHCRANCVSPFCGDGVVDPWEECEGSADGCDPTSCTICGNGNVSGNE